MALLPARNILDGSALPVTSQMKTALGSLRDYLAGLLGTDSTDTSAARTALGAATRGANSDITSLTGLTTPLSMAQGGTGMANGFVSSLAANGYQKLPSGLIIQWGSIAGATVMSPYTPNLVFPVAFPTACYSINAITLNAGTGSGFNARVSNITAASAWIGNSNGASSTSDVINWIAIGK